MSKPLTLAGLLESFFQRRLREQRNASPLTVATYRDALRLLVRYASARTKREPCRLEVRDLDRDVVLGFLDYVERERWNGPRTRNARLTAIRSFFRHVAASDPGALAIAQRVLDIPNKRTILQAPRHLSATAIDAMLGTPDQQTTLGRRDYAFLLFLARTGARVSEAVGLDAADVRLARPPHVLLRGKGRKERVLPMASDLTRTLERLHKERGLGSDERKPVFVGARGGRLTRFGATHVVRRAVRRATVRVPDLARAKVSPHLFRHSLAMRLLQSGSDLVTIQAWLGHASVLTTHRYAEADTVMMRRSLELAGVTPRSGKRFQPKDSVLRILEGL
ncbi:MAG: integrase [Acidobacteria bacterium]|nr:MAG: integrase [Acidobacteriota bacterium]